MTFNVWQASDWSFQKEITINSLDELARLQDLIKDDNHNYGLVVDFRRKTICLYDDYIE